MARRFFDSQGRPLCIFARRPKKQASRRRNNVSRNADLGLESLEPRWVMAAPGTLDSSFSGDGILLDSFASARDEQANVVVVQSDGKLVVAGSTRPVGGADSQVDTFVARYNADGTRDMDFGVGGVTILNVGTAQNFAMDLVIDGSGNIILAGAARNGGLRGFAAVRLDASGDLDMSFGGGDGLAFTQIVDPTSSTIQSAQAQSIALQSDGKIVLGGFVEKSSANGDEDFVLVRYDSSGTIDTTFGSGGIVISHFGSTPTTASFDQVNDIAIQSDGRIVAVGTATGAGGGDFAAVRYNSNGSLDTTFGTGGKVFTDINPNDSQTDIAEAVRIESDGQIVVVGSTASTAINGAAQFAIARYDVNGALDASFKPGNVGSQAGTMRIEFPFRTNPSNTLTQYDNSFGSSFGIMPDGDYIVGGTIGTAPSTDNAFGLVRVNPNGTVDTNFGFDLTGGVDEHGYVLTSFSGTSFTRLNDVVIQADGFIVAAGYTEFTVGAHDDIALTRYDLGLLTADAGGPYVINEPGGSVTLSGSGTGSGLTFAWDLDGDSIFGESGAGAANGDENGANPVFTVSSVDGPNNSFSVTLRVTDSTSFQVFDSAVINILNVAPTLAINGASNVNEGSSYTLNLSSSDPGTDSITSWTINWGDVIEVVSGNPTSVAHTYADGSFSYIISASATDEDGTYTAGNTVPVTVDNVDPTADAGGPYFTFDDTPITLTGSGADVAGAADPLSYAWDLDDNGTFETAGPNATFDPQALGFSGSQTRTVKLQVTDGDGGVTVDTATVEILGVGTAVVDGTLHIVGSNANDLVIITQVGASIMVLASFNSSNPTTFDASSITDIQVRVRGGHDVVVTTPNVTNAMTIDGGSENDLLTGGGGNDVIDGGDGHDVIHGGSGDDIILGSDGNDDLFGGSDNDIIVGGNGDDIIDGGTGRDVLIGSQDEDRLKGGNDDDILVGGYTAHDASVAALDAIMAVWGSSASFSSRVATLTGSGGLLQAGITVFDDDDDDIIMGNAGRDLIFGDTNPWDGAVDNISLNPLHDVLVAVN